MLQPCNTLLPYIWFSYFWSKETMSINFIYRELTYNNYKCWEKGPNLQPIKKFSQHNLSYVENLFISSLSSLHFRFFGSFGFPVKVNSFFFHFFVALFRFILSNASFFLSLGPPILVKVCSFFFVSYFRICFLVAQFRLLTLPFSFSLGPSALSVFFLIP